MMRNLSLIFIAAFTHLTIGPAFADNLWIEGTGADDPGSAKSVAVTRSLSNFGLQNVSAGIRHSQVGSSSWTLGNIGVNHRFSDKLILDGNAQLGKGKFDGNTASYQKVSIGGTWLLSDRWYVALQDTYINIDQTIGHVISTTLTRVGQTGFDTSLSVYTSLGDDIDNQQVGLSFRWQRHLSWMGGVYVGESTSGLALNGFGNEIGGSTVQIRQAYGGVSLDIGKTTLLGTIDHLRLDNNTRTQVSLVLRIPLGRPGRPSP